MSPTMQRVTGGLVLLVTGLLSLPLAAALLDGEGTENWIFIAQLLAMAAIGAAVTVGLPALARPGASTRGRVLTGVGWGVVATVVGAVVFWLLLNGFNGA